MATTASGAAVLGSIEALKRVKATETEWDTRLSAARQESEEALRRLRDDGDATVKAAETEADREADPSGSSAPGPRPPRKARRSSPMAEGRRTRRSR